MKLLLVVCVVMVTLGAGAANCPEPYSDYEISGRCLYEHTSELSFSDASNYCQQRSNGHVVRLKTTEDEQVTSAFLQDETALIWNGLKDEDADGVFEFTDGTSIGTHKPWDPEPQADATKICAQREDYGAAAWYWKTANCENLANVVCETSPIIPPCDALWIENPDANTCVRAITGKRRSYTRASEYCIGLGGELATKATTLTERKRLMKLMKFQGHFFIGVDDKNNDGTYEYIDDGSALGSQRPFRKGRAPAGRCVTLKRRLWYPKSCTRRLFFICEKTALSVKS